MTARTPEDWPTLFSRSVNAGDLEAIVALYDADARFVAPTGETLVGRDEIRRVLAGLIGSKTQFRSQVVQAVTVGDIALLYTDFQVTSVDTSGKSAEVNQKAVEVLRRQPDGAWRLIIGHPNGRA